MKKIEQPDGSALILFDEGPVPFKSASGQMLHISLSDAQEMLDTLVGIAAVADDPSYEDEGPILHIRQRRAFLDSQIRILAEAIRNHA